ncbi:hypothetical protein [Streptomyces sp. NPDC057582]|uniref:hypothetical protein n=1 Tax=unclassified Streptomyces TaxID=2593676 RepID=UPI0036998018
MSDLDPGSLPHRPRSEPRRRRQSPWVLLVVVLLPAGAGAAAVGVVADVSSREGTNGAFATAACGGF